MDADVEAGGFGDVVGQGVEILGGRGRGVLGNEGDADGVVAGAAGKGETGQEGGDQGGTHFRVLETAPARYDI